MMNGESKEREDVVGPGKGKSFYTVFRTDAAYFTFSSMLYK